MVSFQILLRSDRILAVWDLAKMGPVSPRTWCLLPKFVSAGLIYILKVKRNGGLIVDYFQIYPNFITAGITVSELEEKVIFG